MKLNIHESNIEPDILLNGDRDRIKQAQEYL